MATKTFICKNNPNSFCYICGQFIKKHQYRNITDDVRQAYFHYFGFAMQNEDKPWTPNGVCPNCRLTLCKWLCGEKRHLKFAKPMIWTEAVDHSQCYFCEAIIEGGGPSNFDSRSYPNVASATKPVNHKEASALPTPPCIKTDKIESGSSSALEVSFGSSNSKNRTHLISQSELNDLVRDLNLSKVKSEMLASCLQKRNFLEPETTITCFRGRGENFSQFFVMHEKITYCCDIEGLFKELKLECKTREWRLFIDRSKQRLKVALVHNGNELPTIPVAHAVSIEETYDQIAQILKLISYEKYHWEISADLKVVAIITGLQGGYPKSCCFLCLWDSKAKKDHFTQSSWPKREQHSIGNHNLVNPPLIPQSDVILPPLHIKLGLMKSFVKALQRHESPAFHYLVEVFPNLTHNKVKEGIFVGPQMRKLMRDRKFIKMLSNRKAKAWSSFKQTVEGFLGNRKDPNYKIIVNDLIKNYNAIGGTMSLKMHFLHSHLDFFPDNLGTESDDQVERFHQDILTIENRYEGCWDAGTLGDYCWNIIRETNPLHYKKYNKTAHIPQYKN